MCVDDYKERLSGAIRPRACRRFLIEDEEGMSRTFYVNISQFEEQNQEIALCKILIYLGQKGLILANRKFYMPKFKSIVEPFTFCRIKFEALNETVIILKSYAKSKDNNQIFTENQQSEKDKQELSPLPQLTACYLRFEMTQQESHHFEAMKKESNKMEEECQCMASSEDNSGNEDKSPLTSVFLPTKNLPSIQMQEQKEQDDVEHLQSVNEREMESQKRSSNEISPISTPSKRTREPQRQIGEVLYMAKVWRQLHEKKRWSLIQAARLIGISKKSLDDYYLVLRAGQMEGYDFVGNMNHGMGELRYFLRSKAHKASGKLNNYLQSFNILPELNLDYLIQQFTKGNKFQSVF